MATGTRSLPTDSPIPYFQPIERGYMSEGSQEGVHATPYVDPSEHTVNIGGTDYHSEITETDRVSTFTGFDDYDTLLLLDMAEEHWTQFLRWVNKSQQPL